MKEKQTGLRAFKRMLVLILTAAMLMSFIPVSVFADEQQSAAEYYVSSENGDDKNPGTLEAPFATIQKARDTIREVKASGNLPSGGITVYLREGIYTQYETLTFTKEDSGTAECPITYKGYNGEKVLISGGYVLDPDDFVTPDQSVLDRMQTEEARSKLLAYDLGVAGVNYRTALDFVNGAKAVNSILFYGGERAWPGRYPNYVAGEQCYLYFEKYSDSPRSFYDSDHRVKNWSEESIKNARLYGMFEIDWSTSYGHITNYDRDTERVTFDGSWSTASGRYTYFNVLEEVDTVGEYFIDETNDMLYFYPPENYRDIEILIPVCNDSVVLADVEYYTFDGLTMEAGINNILTVNGDHNTIKNCTVGCSEEVGIKYSGSDFIITDCEISRVGGTCINGKGGDKLKIVDSGNRITNNKLHDFGELYRVYNGAIYLEGIGYTIDHNEIYYGPHTAMCATAQNVLMEYNYIHNVCYEAGDAGAIYTGGWCGGDYIFRHNIMENIVNKSSPYLNPNGYYSDNSGAGKHVYSNLFINIDGSAICFSGQDCVARDNILYNTGELYTDARSYYPFPNDKISGWTAYSGGLGTIFPTGALWVDLLGHPQVEPYGYATKMWAYRCPWTMLLKTTNVYDLEDKFVGYAFGNSIIRNNALCGANSTNCRVFTTTATERLMNFRDNPSLTTVQLGLISYGNGKYAVSGDSKLERILPGFKLCDFENVGIVNKD